MGVCPRYPLHKQRQQKSFNFNFNFNATTQQNTAGLSVSAVRVCARVPVHAK